MRKGPPPPPPTQVLNVYVSRNRQMSTLCLLGNFSASAYFFKIIFKKNPFRNTIRVSNSMVPDQAQNLVEPDLGPNCLQILRRFF